MSDERENTGAVNSGHCNSGNWNSGNWNSGDCNSGSHNSGFRNSGDCNSGDHNSGYRNSGYRNSGSHNSGFRNSGFRNSGDCNSGDCNSGNRNSGDCNSGNRNSGYGNATDRSAGIFCTEEPDVICFDKPSGKKWDEIDHPRFYEFYLTKWIAESEMTDAEKIAEPEFRVRGGYLKTFTCHEAWANYWRDCDDEEKQRVLNLPNFNAGKFKDITGIDVTAESNVGTKDVSCAGKVVEIDGKKYRLEEVK